MLRAGLIRRVAAGIYNWMPMGLRVLRKEEQVVREEMERAGALELTMPVVQPGELWEESGRWEQYGPELCRLEDRHQRPFCLGPTHEEIITQIARSEIKSYKQLPINLFQIQTKFRDEIRPRFGVMRSREFIMKDAYSFHIDQASQEATYWRMHEAYTTIFRRLGLDFRAVEADTGSIGGNHSHEFHVLANPVRTPSPSPRRATTRPMLSWPPRSRCQPTPRQRKPNRQNWKNSPRRASPPSKR